MIRDEEFGTAEDYVRAFTILQREGIAKKHLALLQAHFKAPNHTTTWAQIAETVGYANGNAVNLQYGKFAERIARQLGLNDKPLDPNGNAWWLWALVRWASERDPSGHTMFVLRRPVIEALTQLGILSDDGTSHSQYSQGIPSWESIEQDLDRRVREAQTLSSEERHKHLAQVPKRPERVWVNTTVFLRNPYVISEVLARANGVCEECHAPAPFVRISNVTPYLEVHHRVRLADEGEDTVANAIALCPNCHRKAHYG